MKKQKGITLVALVITIIVLLILAMVSIKIVMDGGLTTGASKATDTHTIEAEKEAITTGYAAYQIDLIKSPTLSPTLLIDGATATPKGEDWSVTFTKTNNEYELKKDGTITLTKQGNGSTTTVVWTDNGDDTFTKGDVTLKVGDIVNYNEGTGYSTTVEASKSGHIDVQTFKTDDLNWRVLGINTKGELELISDNPTSKELFLAGELGYLNAEDILNNMCNELYGKGEHATGARSLNVEDINKLGNYDPTTYIGYGDIYTYRFPTSGEYMQYKRTKADGTLVTDWTDITDSNYQTFKAPGKAEISADNRSDTGISLKKIEYDIMYNVAEKVKQTTSDGKKMSDIISSYRVQFLASRCTICLYSFAIFSISSVSTSVGGSGLYNSYGSSGKVSTYVRPVVTLKSDIRLSGNSNDGWTIN